MNLTKTLTEEGFLSSITPNIYRYMYHDVKQFRHSFKLPTEVGAVFQVKDTQLHFSLITEELHETFSSENRVDKLDGLIDTAYVILGYCVHKGYSSLETLRSKDTGFYCLLDCILSYTASIDADFMSVWEAVHTSNMSKRCGSLKELQGTLEFYTSIEVPCVYDTVDPSSLQEEFPDLHEDEVPTLYIVRVKEDCTDISNKPLKQGKVLKSVGYNPANLIDF